MTEQSAYPMAEDYASFLMDLLGPPRLPALEYATEITMTQIENATAYLLVSFVHGDSKRNGIIMGVRYELPNKVKDSEDFPGTFYKALTDDHGQKKIYRYVPLDRVADFLEDTDTGDKVLEKALSVDQIEIVMEPTPGEIWVDTQGTTYLVLENGYWAASDGTIHCPQCDTHLDGAERQARSLSTLAG